MRPRLVRGESEAAEDEGRRCVWKDWWRPGDVGGRGRGADDIECVPLRWSGALRGGFGDTGAVELDDVDDEERVFVFVNVTVSSISSPAK